MHPLRNERGLILSWLLKITLVLGVIGVVMYDGARIGLNRFGLDDDARAIALEMSDDVDGSSRFNPAPLKKKAEGLAQEVEARLLAFEIDEEGVVHVRLRRRAETLVVSRIGAIEDWARAEAEGRAASN